LQPIIIDARGHLMGRLAAIVAKTILQGKTILFFFIFASNCHKNLILQRKDNINSG
jgi:ribosomal protein L13